MQLYSFGNKRKCQLDKMEDAIHIGDIHNYYVFIIADGNGGSAGGVNIGQLSVNLMLNYLNKVITDLTSIKDIMNSLDLGFYCVSQALQAVNVIDSKYEAVYCSMSVLLISKDTYQTCFGSVGNTEISMIRNGQFTRMNEVHSEAGEALRKGEIEEFDFYNYPGRAILTSALGVYSNVQCDILNMGRLQQDDIILLTTDGIYRYFTPDKVIQTLGEAEDINSGVNEVLEEVDNEGGEDNASLIVIHLY